MFGGFKKMGAFCTTLNPMSPWWHEGSRQRPARGLACPSCYSEICRPKSFRPDPSEMTSLLVLQPYTGQSFFLGGGGEFFNVYENEDVDPL